MLPVHRQGVNLKGWVVECRLTVHKYPQELLLDLEADPKILEPESWKRLLKTAGTKSRTFELAEQELR